MSSILTLDFSKKTKRFFPDIFTLFDRIQQALQDREYEKEL